RRGRGARAAARRRGRQQEGRRGIDAGERRPVVSSIQAVRPGTGHRGGGVARAGGRDGHTELGAGVTVHANARPLEIGEQVGGQERGRDVLQLGPDDGGREGRGHDRRAVILAGV
ncbi:MAG: hypothetical protein ACK55I_13545, partial [bacterium]